MHWPVEISLHGCCRREVWEQERTITSIFFPKLCDGIWLWGLICWIAKSLAVEPEVGSLIPHSASLIETGLDDPEGPFQLCCSKLVVLRPLPLTLPDGTGV